FVRASLAAAAAAPLFAFTLACSKPEPPKLTPKQASVTGLTLTGVDLRLQVDAQNPNGFDLTTQSVTAKVMVDGKYDLGTYTTTSSMTLPAGQTVTIDVPVNVKWSDLTQMGALAASNRPIPYTVDGTAKIGSAKLNVDVPFHLDGKITQDD